MSTILPLSRLLEEIVANDANYIERYNLIWQAMGQAAAEGIPVGILLDPAEPEWPCVYIELPTGQVSWHMPKHSCPYDGHTTEEKFRRIQAFTRKGDADAS